MSEISFGVRTPLRLVRVKIGSEKTIADVKAQVAKDIGVEPKQLTISLTPAGDSPLSDKSVLSSMGIGGKVIFGVLPKSVDIVSAAYASPVAGSPAPSAGGAATPVEAAPSPVKRVLTERCTHGPHGACQYCAGATDDEIRALKNNTINKTTVERHVAKSEATAATGDVKGEVEWLCRHRPDQMCVNCAPIAAGEKVDLPMLCQHGPEGKCVNCLTPDTTVDGRKFVTYDEWLESARAKCSHSFSATCVNCAPPSDVRYKLKEGCQRHKPWPGGICLECAPTTVDLKRQPYRHIDFITVNATADIKAMIDLVSVNESMNVQRGGIMYGRYAPDPNFRHGQRAVVDAIYEPPQVCDRATGAVKMLPDPKADTVAAIAGALGLQPVGWVFTRKPTVKSKGVDLMPHESYAVAAQQLKHSPRPDGRSGSQFVTLSIYKGEDSMYALQGYMVSDQLMAMVRDNVITLPAASDVKFTRREVKKDVPGELPVPEIIVKDTVRGAYRADTFDPDFCIVSIEAGAGSGSATSTSAYGASDAIKAAAVEKSKPIFKHPGDFPIENRQAFRIEQDGTALQRLFNTYKTEPLQARLSNFHVLLYLAVLLDVNQAVACAKAVATNTPVPKEIADTLSMLTSLM